MSRHDGFCEQVTPGEGYINPRSCNILAGDELAHQPASHYSLLGHVFYRIERGLDTPITLE